MDYAFVPGTTPYDKAMKRLFTNRASTTLVAVKGVNNITQFFDYLAGNVTTPLGDVFIGSHGSETAYIKAAFDIMSPHTIFEMLDNALKPPRTGQLVDKIINPRPKDSSENDIPAHLYIRGCRIGILTPFIQKLKTVVNGLSTTDIKVGAPLFFHAANPVPEGVIESFVYDFHIFTKTKIVNRADLLAAFSAGGFVDTYGNNITLAQWNAWIPKDIFKEKAAFLYPKLLGTPLKSSEVFATGLYRYRDAKSIESIVVPTFVIDDPFGTIPSDPAQLPAFMKNVIKTLIANPPADGKDFIAEFADTHPLPYYKRYEYASLDEMIDNLVWKGTPASRIYTGSRYEYYVGPPLVNNNANNELIYNFYPDKKAKPAASAMFANDSNDVFNIV